MSRNGNKIVSAVLLMVAAVSLASACSSAAAAAIKPTIVKAAVLSDGVSIPVSAVVEKKMTHVGVATPTGTETFMAYQLGETLYARASICPPCRSRSFSLVGDKLVCNSCGTVFEAKTGKGVKGACVAYPKASVAYEVNSGNIIMKTKDLLAAYQQTLQPR